MSKPKETHREPTRAECVVFLKDQMDWMQNPARGGPGVMTAEQCITFLEALPMVRIIHVPSVRGSKIKL